MNQLNFVGGEFFGKVYWLLHVLEYFFLASSLERSFTFDYLEQ